MRKVRTLASLSALLAVALPTAAHSTPTATTLYFHSPSRVASADQALRTVGADGPWLDATAPTSDTPAVSEPQFNANGDARFPTAAAWTGAVRGQVTGPVTVTFWATAAVSKVTVQLYADGTDTAAGKILGEKTVTTAPTPGPAEYTAVIDGVDTFVDHELAVAIHPVTGGAVFVGQSEIYSDSADYPSNVTFTLDDAAPAPPGGGGSAPTGTDYLSYKAPFDAAYVNNPNETSLGVNPTTNAAMFQMSLTTAKVTWNDTVSPPAATWTDVSYLSTSLVTLDPYLYTDRATGRTYVNQLAGEASITAYTDDDGATWHDVVPASTAPSFDHESLSSGPYAAGAGPAVPGSYAGGALYYCSQGLLVGQCVRSDDGGTTWGAPLPFSVFDECQPSHGRVVVGPDGTVYLPVGTCFDADSNPFQGVFVSHDSGVTWKQVRVPGTGAGHSDPAISIDKAGKVYYVTSSNGTVVVSTSTDSGETWSTSVDVGALNGMKNAEFPMTVAGDPGRVGIAWYGSTTPGDDQATGYTGEWHLYVATSIDGGSTWSVVDATGSDPVQRGMICLSGTTCDTGRNLLDFQSMAIDRDGRILVGYADGCITEYCIGAKGANNQQAGSTDSWGTIARQMTGPLLLGTSSLSLQGNKVGAPSVRGSKPTTPRRP